jgi:diguanylate cyclase (GGDEF)-like protein
MLQGSYSLPLVLASLFIASIASYTTLDLAERIRVLRNLNHRVYWLAGGALSMGLGIWSMHFIGMLSFSLPIPLGYDTSITTLSLLIAVAIAYFALDIATRHQLSWSRNVLSGALLGLGISAMHYSGMAAMRMDPGISYTPWILALSVVIAMVAATAALRLAHCLRGRKGLTFWLYRPAAALVMGLAITGMHYTGMAAANFPLDSICRAARDVDNNWLALSVGGATFGILALTVVMSFLDARLESHTAHFIRRLKHQATHDALTGLANRKHLTERLQDAFAEHQARTERFALFFIDLDGFKAINDSFGHSTGDAVLKDVAQRLTAAVRRHDLVARFGGDEFVVLIEDVGSMEDVEQIGDKLIAAFGAEFELPDINMMLSPSIGISVYPDHGDSVDVLLGRADAAMYEVKASGRNHYRFYEEAMSASTIRKIKIQQGLVAAIREGQFYLLFQPKFDCRDGALVGAEALLRWRHPELGMVSPGEFIPIAEKSGHIIAVGNWVLEQVCVQLSMWEAQGDSQLQIAVNISPVQLRAPSLVDDILAITQRHRVDPASIMLEITESAAMHNAELTHATIEKLKAAGFMLAIDDFGTGYSSLSYLQEFGIHQLKVDRAFVNALNKADGKGHAVVSAIIGLAHALGLEVVAEGVETEAQLDVLKRLHCDQIQGFLLGTPMPSGELRRLAEERVAGTGTAPEAVLT